MVDCKDEPWFNASDLSAGILAALRTQYNNYAEMWA